MTEDWGERRAAAREARARRRAAWIVGCGLAAAFGGQFVAGFADGILGRPAGTTPFWVEAACMAVFSGAGLALLLLGLRDMDEVQRQRAVTMLATVGLLNIILRPVVLLIGPPLGMADPQHGVWIISLFGGLLAMVARDAWRRR